MVIACKQRLPVKQINNQAGRTILFKVFAHSSVTYSIALCWLHSTAEMRE